MLDKQIDCETQVEIRVEINQSIIRLMIELRSRFLRLATVAWVMIIGVDHRDDIVISGPS